MKDTSENKTVEQDQEFNKSATAGLIFLKATLLSLAFATIMLLITALAIGAWGVVKLNTFAKLADTSIDELKTTFKTGWEMPVSQTNNKMNILLLGVDTLESRPGSTALTDTIMMISLDIKSGKISTLSLPRDLWSKDYKTRINALYFYGQEKYPDKPERFAKEVIEEMTGIDIHHTIVLSIDSVAEIIDILDGIEVNVKKGFTDTQFPRPNVDVTLIKDPKKLYETIIFEEGLQHMDGERTLQFIRSRKSDDDQGDDLSRAKRQQLIISSLTERVKSLNVLKDAETLAELYKSYKKNYGKQFSIEEGIATIRTIMPVRDQIEFSSSSLSVYPEDKTGVITNPPVYKYSGEWVYEIRNSESFKNEVLSKLDLK